MIEELAVHCVSAVVQSSYRQRGYHRHAIDRREEDEDLLLHFKKYINEAVSWIGLAWLGCVWANLLGQIGP
jgi:hypothetical protein